MAVARRAFDLVDNKQYYTQWLKTNILFDTLFLSCLKQAPFKVYNDDTLVPTMVYLAWYRIHLKLYLAKPVNWLNILVASWAELMGPQISILRIPELVYCNMFINAVSCPTWCHWYHWDCHRTIKPFQPGNSVLAQCNIQDRIREIDAVLPPEPQDEQEIYKVGDLVCVKNLKGRCTTKFKAGLVEVDRVPYHVKDVHPFQESHSSGNESNSEESVRPIQVGSTMPESDEDSSVDKSPANEPALPSSLPVSGWCKSTLQTPRQSSWRCPLQ